MADQWYYRMFGEEFGPVSFDKLKELADGGTIQALDQVRSGSTDWVAAATIDALKLSTSVRSTATALQEADISDFDLSGNRNKRSNSSHELEIADISDFDLSTPQTATDEWFCLMGENELGPLSFDELVKFAEHEQLSADDQVKLGSSGKWRRVGSIGRLMAALPYQAHNKTITRAPKPKAVQTPAPPTAPAAPVATRTPTPPSVAIPDPDATYRVAYEQAKAKLTESMLAQADAAFKTAEEQAKSHVAWATAPNVDRYWWGWANGVEFGPVEFSQVFGLAKSGQLKGSDFVRNGSHGQFVPSQNIPGLFQAVELIARASETRNLAKAQAQAAAAVALPPPAAPVALLKAAEQAIAAEQQAKSSPVIATQPAPTAPKSNPTMDAVRERPRTGSDPQVASRTPAPVRVPEPEPTPEPVPEPSRPAYSSMNSNSYGSMSGGFSSSSSSMSTYGASRPTPAPIPAKSYAKKSSASDSRWLSDMLDNLKEPKAIGAICAIALVGLIFGWQYLPKSRGADIQKYQALKQILDEVQTKRQGAPAELAAVQQKLTKVAKEIAVELKDKANPRDPAKQCLLWAARDEAPRMCQAGLATESLAEKNFAAKLKDAAVELGLEKRPPVDMAQLAARSNDD